jgi:undecaprenyl-diphosphatase
MPTRTPLTWPLLALAAYGGLLALVVADWSALESADGALSGWFRESGHARPEVVDVVRVVTDVMGTLSFLAVGLAATVLLAASGRRRAAGFCAAVTAVVPILWSVQHTVLHNPRPLDGFVVITSNGFPSGHTSHATAAAVAAVLLLWPRLRRAGRVAVTTTAAAFAIAIGLTRAALLAHWPSDVLGGWLLGVAVVPLLAAAVNPRGGPAPGPGSPPAPARAARASSESG